MQSKVINFEVVKPPRAKEVQGKDWIYYGEKNDYPRVLRELAETSPLHSTILKAKVDGIVGAGLESETHPTLLAYANTDGESWTDVLRKAAQDFTMYGGFALNLVWSKDRSMVYAYHLDFGNVRVCANKDDSDQYTGYYYSNKWHNTSKYPPKYFERWSMASEADSTILCYMPYFSGMEAYPIPDYSGALSSINLSSQVMDFHQYNLQSGLTPSLWVNFPSQPADEDLVKDIYRDIERNYGGVENAGKFILTFSDGPENTPSIQTIQTSVNDEYYSTINEMTERNILSAHRVISPALVGIKDDGFNIGKSEVLEAYTVWQKTVIEPYQNQMLGIFERLLKINAQGEDVELSIEPNSIFDEEGDLDI